jgi:hypothetical protein
MNQLCGLVLRCASLCIYQTVLSFKLDYIQLKRNVSDNIDFNLEKKITLIEALVAIEDKRFFSHKGVDFFSVVRAFVRNSYSERLEGASTITQQLVRVITDNRKILISRKIKEVLLAALIEHEFSKNQIISAYMKSYRFIEIKGLEEFCENENYDFNTLSFSNSIEIAGRFKYPHINPTNYTRYLKRVRTIEKKLSPTLTVKCIPSGIRTLQ